MWICFDADMCRCSYVLMPACVDVAMRCCVHVLVWTCVDGGMCRGGRMVMSR